MQSCKHFKFFVLLLLSSQQCQARIRFTNIICNATDPSYGLINRCDLKAVSRNVQYFTLSATVFQVPITDISIRVQLMQRLNGWKPFLYDVTLRCNFTRTGNYMIRYLWGLARNLSNVKNDCPYNQKLFDLPRLDNTYVESVLYNLPVPTGKYGVFATVKTFNITRILVSFQATVE